MRLTTLFLLLYSPIFGQNADIRLLHNLNNGYAPNWDKAMQITSHSVYPIGLLTPTYSLGLGYFGKFKDNRQGIAYRRQAISMTAGMGATLAVAVILKQTVQRPRPYDEYPQLIQAKTTENSYSFPSGHSALSFSSATALTLAYPKWYVAIPAYAWAGTVAYSRMRLGVHYPTDVLTGAAIGIGTTWLTWRLTQKWRNKATQTITPVF